MKYLYRIRHKPTGKYYSPRKGRGLHQTNLTPRGKWYMAKPNLRHIGHGYMYAGKTLMNKFVESEWEIVKYKVVEAD